MSEPVTRWWVRPLEPIIVPLLWSEHPRETFFRLAGCHNSATALHVRQLHGEHPGLGWTYVNAEIARIRREHPIRYAMLYAWWFGRVSLGVAISLAWTFMLFVAPVLWALHYVVQHLSVKVGWTP